MTEISHQISPRVVQVSTIALILFAPLRANSQEQELEEITVTGIRGSMMHALDVKRNSDTGVDAISAEDIRLLFETGKFSPYTVGSRM